MNYKEVEKKYKEKLNTIENLDTIIEKKVIEKLPAKVQKPVLASSGLSPLKECVEKFSLGVFIQPDSISALKNGITKVLTNEYPKPSWKEYSSYASWDINANIILEILLES